MGKLQEASYTKGYLKFTITENSNPSQATPEQGFPSTQPHTPNYGADLIALGLAGN